MALGLTKTMKTRMTSCLGDQLQTAQDLCLTDSVIEKRIFIGSSKHIFDLGANFNSFPLPADMLSCSKLLKKIKKKKIEQLYTPSFLSTFSEMAELVVVNLSISCCLKQKPGGGNLIL